MVSTTGEHAQWFELDDALRPVEAPMPAEVRKVVERIGENCEPALATVLFVGGAGGSLRAGVTENPVLLTRSIKDLLTNVTCGGAPAFPGRSPAPKPPPPRRLCGFSRIPCENREW